MSEPIYIGIDSGATTSKIAAVRADGSIFPSELLQRPTSSEGGPAAVIAAWIGAINEFLAQHGLAWSQVEGVGLAVPGPRRSYGVLDTSPNLPAEFDGWNVENDLRVALERESGRILPLALGNDGNLGGIRDTALKYLWPTQRKTLRIVPATLGELSQAVGAALVARHIAQN